MVGRKPINTEVRFNKNGIKFFVRFMEIFLLFQKFDVMIDIHVYKASLPHFLRKGNGLQLNTEFQVVIQIM
jgi:hypothetical protein